MKLSGTLSLLMACATPSAMAANIVWISDQIADSNTPPALSDQGFVNLLTAAGHTVTRGFAAPATRPAAATLDAADLVIIGRSAGSASFSAGDNAAFWNGVTTPMLSTNPYALRPTQLGWNTAGNIVDQISSTVTFANPGSPASAYLIGSVPMTGSTTTNSLTEAITFYNGAVDIRGTSISTDAPVAGGTVIASTVVGAGPATAAFIAFWPAGTVPSGSNPGQTFGDFRMEFFAGNRESATAPVNNVPHAGYENLTADGEAMFLRAVNLAVNRGSVVPEPGSTALAFAAGALAMGRRRRSSTSSRT